MSIHDDITNKSTTPKNGKLSLDCWFFLSVMTRLISSNTCTIKKYHNITIPEASFGPATGITRGYPKKIILQ